MNGLIIQWGTQQNTGSVTTANLFLAYTNSNYFAIFCPNSTSTNDSVFYHNGHIVDESKIQALTGGLKDMRWFTIGY